MTLFGWAGLAGTTFAAALLQAVSGFGFAVLAVAVIMAGFRFRGGRPWAPFARTRTGDLAAGAVAGVATALVGMAGPPVLIYLLLVGTAAQTVRATLLAFFALSYGATVASHVATVGIPGSTWVAAGVLAPFAVLGGLAGRPVGDRLRSNGFAILASALLTVAGLFTVA